MKKLLITMLVLIAFTGCNTATPVQRDEATPVPTYALEAMEDLEDTMQSMATGDAELERIADRFSKLVDTIVYADTSTEQLIAMEQIYDNCIDFTREFGATREKAGEVCGAVKM